MRHHLGSARYPAAGRQPVHDDAWSIVVAAADGAEAAARANQPAAFVLDDERRLHPLAAADPNGVIGWRPGLGWHLTVPREDPRHSLIDLYLPICSATGKRPVTVGHLGQSLDGFIATHAGESQYVTGQENILHLHRMRALCDAVVVGAGTVAADDPQLTTRHVPGSSPLRVVLDPTRRLTDRYRVFSDASAETLYVCAKSLTRPGESHFGRATLVAVEDHPTGVHVAELQQLLLNRGCTRIFVEGGGVTVSAFLQENLLDRLHVAIAPLIIGEGRPAIRLLPPIALSDCLRPRYRVFRMGGDVLFDCDLKPDSRESADPRTDGMPPVTRVI